MCRDLVAVDLGDVALYRRLRPKIGLQECEQRDGEGGRREEVLSAVE